MPHDLVAVFALLVFPGLLFRLCDDVARVRRSDKSKVV